MIRSLILLHRYLGIILGILVSLWCLSAFVMMYVRYPALTEAEALIGLDAIDLADCCPGVDEALSDAPLRAFGIEAVAGRPMLRVDGGSGRLQIDLSTGEVTAGIGLTLARAQAARYLANAGIRGTPGDGELIVRDQWTVAGGFDRHRPLYRFRADDAEATEIYVSSATGEAVQQTTRRERFWNWLGSVVHWLYPTLLRQHPGAWVQTIAWTTIASLFLVVTGLWIGLRQYFARRSGRRSPYRGAALWHHYFGLFFGLLTLTWLASGLFSVNPWGFLEGGAAGGARQRLAGAVIDPRGLPALLQRLRRDLPAGVVRIESSLLAGEFSLLAYRHGGGFDRLHPVTLAPWPLSTEDLRQAAALLAPANARVAAAELLHEQDHYYFAHHDAVDLPVYRVILDDNERTRYYLDPGSGRLLKKVDADGRWSRWLFEALHRGDFTHWLRQRPTWDFVMIVLLVGVTTSAVTGTWLGARRLLRNPAGDRRRRRATGEGVREARETK